MVDRIERLLRMPEGHRRTAAIAAWVQSLFSERPPVLVGGAAVELYTKGAYTSGDFDFVGHVPIDVARRLGSEGFRKEGRHWIHERGQLFVEFPSSSLGPGDKTATIRVGSSQVLTLKPEALIVDRLASWQFWKSGIDGANAHLLWRKNRDRLDRRYLAELAKVRNTEEALRRLLAFGKRFARRAPSRKELEKWAETRF